jgi:multidrug efflux system outer membrane protein
LSYKNTLIKAFTEVDGAIVSYKKDKKVNASYQRKLDNSRELVGIAKAHYTSGLSDYIDYLDNKVNFLQSKIDFTHQQLIVIQDIVQVYKTLGLGIDEQPPSNG